jgi:hypothetical protein
LRLDASGAPMGPPTVLQKTDLDRHAIGPVFFSSPAGVVAVWKYHPAPYFVGAYAVTLRSDGRPLGSPRLIATVRWLDNAIDIVNIRGDPFLLTERDATVMPFDRTVSLAGPPATLAATFASGTTPTLLSTGDQAYLLWFDTRHAREELFLAPLRCGGATPQAPRLPRPARETASAPAPSFPPDPSFTCPSFDVAEERVVPFTSAAPMKDELWVQETEYAAKESSEREVYLERYQLPTLARLSVRRRLGTFHGYTHLLAVPSGGLVIHENAPSGHIEALRLAPDGLPVGKPTLISDPLTESVHFLGLAAGAAGAGIFWRAGPSYLTFRAVPISGSDEPSAPLQLPQRVDEFRATASRDGFVAAWFGAANRLSIARLVTLPAPRFEWLVEVDSAIADFIFGVLAEVAVVGDQIYVVAQKNEHIDGAVILRFGLDGARLGVTELPGVRMFAAKASEKGIVVYGYESDTKAEPHARVLCLHRLALDVREVGRAACVDRHPTAGTRGMLFWSHDELYSLSDDSTGDFERTLRRWGCRR